jgi:pyruvate dehydrogenase E2 component (dihydrolipoamide acetyltransferase)
MIKKDHLSIVPASPKARKFARELGIDINKISGSERQGRVTERDIKLFVSTKSFENNEQNEIKKDEKLKQEYLHSEFGEIEIKDIPRVKKLS